MKHTQGKASLCGNTLYSKGENGVPICNFPLDYKTACESSANAERVKALWNAANGLTIEEAIKRLNGG